MTAWEQLERDVRAAAQAKWKLPCVAETIHGVRCDAVIRLREDYLILIEVTRSSTLQKLREDLAKHGIMRAALMAEQKYAECYFVTAEEESSLVASGRGLNVEVLSLASFSAKFMGSEQYLAARRTKTFGSAVDPDTGTQDNVPYTKISYVDNSGAAFSVSDIAAELTRGRHIVLQGEFGTGKSRCFWAVFEELAKHQSMFMPVAINLRENWGYNRFHHIIQNHLDALGLGEFYGSTVQSLTAGNHSVLLDGFDEIGSQSWGGDPARLAEVRMQSHRGVRDLVSECTQCGILITGREHYFNSDEEMEECLGLSPGYLSLRCPDEFTDGEIIAYLQAAVGVDVVPDWLPKKPLVCRLLADLSKEEIADLQESASGEVDFFERVFIAVCAREKLINAPVAADAIRSILLTLAQISRKHTEKGEKVTIAEINQAFMEATGVPPIDESAILLQRLPYLGRIGGGSPDRIFIDPYAKDGLRGLALSNALQNLDEKLHYERWKQPLGPFGVQVLAEKMPNKGAALKYVKQAVNRGNEQIACDYVAVLNWRAEGDVDYGSLIVSSGAISSLSFSNSTSSNLTLNDVYIDKIVLDGAVFQNVFFNKCVVNLVEGAGKSAALPEAFAGTCHVEKFEPALTVSRISEMQLSNEHKTLLAVIKKLFFQPGAARQEEALLRGAEAYWDAATAESVLKYMIANKLVLKGRGDHGALYIPQRRHTRRMGRILDERASSGDELWDRVLAA